MKRYVVPLLLFLGLAATYLAPVAAQEQPAITVNVQAGYDGAYRIAEWFPVVVSVANAGPDVRGVLEWSFPGQSDETTFRHAIDLPNGSSKRVTLYAFSRDFVQSGQIQVLTGGTLLAEQSVGMEAVDPNRFLIGVISSDPALLNSLDSLSIAATDGTIVQHLDAADLPELPAALRGINALFFHAVDSKALTAAQRDALTLWVSLGGQLIVSGGAAGQETAAGLADLLPVDVTGGIAQGDLAPLVAFANANTPPQPTMTTLSEALPRTGAEQLLPDTNLLVRWGYGAGTVTFSAFDLAALRGWGGETRLWRQVLTPTDIFAPGTDARRQRSNLLQNVLQLPSLGLPPAGALFCFLVAYILVIGPLNYLLLRRLRRLEWAWMTIPLAVLTFAVGLYVVGFGLRGGRSQVNQVAVVQGIEGQPRGFATAFVGLFSPRRATYTVAFPSNSLVSEALDWNSTPGQPALLLRDDAGVELPNVLIDVASVRTFTAEMSTDVLVSIQSDLRERGGEVRGEIRNTGPEALDDVLIVHGGTFQQLGTIAAGATQQVALDSALQTFPMMVDLPTTGLFNRQQLLSSLFNSGRFRFSNPNNPNGEVFDTQSIYLLAWSDRSVVPLRLNGQEVSQEGLTLSIIRLNTNG